MAINVFDSFLKEFEQPITTFVSTSVSNLASYIDGPLARRRDALCHPLWLCRDARRDFRADPGFRLAGDADRGRRPARDQLQRVPAICHGAVFRLPCRRKSAMPLAGSGLNTNSGSSVRSTAVQRDRRRQQDLRPGGLDQYRAGADRRHSPGLCRRRLVSAIRHPALCQNRSRRRHRARPDLHCAGIYSRRRARLPKPGCGRSRIS